MRPAEIEHIGQHFSPEGQTVLTQARAVPAAIRTSDPDQFRYIHFVAHGTASRSSPLDSAVVLSPAHSESGGFQALREGDRPASAAREIW